MNADKDNAGTLREGSHKFSLGQGNDYFQNKRKHRAVNFRAVSRVSTPNPADSASSLALIPRYSSF